MGDHLGRKKKRTCILYHNTELTFDMLNQCRSLMKSPNYSREVIRPWRPAALIIFIYLLSDNDVVFFSLKNTINTQHPALPFPCTCPTLMPLQIQRDHAGITLTQSFSFDGASQVLDGQFSLN